MTDFFANRFFTPSYFAAPHFGARQEQGEVERGTGVYGLAAAEFGPYLSGAALRRRKKEAAPRNTKSRNVMRGPKGARYQISEDDAATLAAILASL